MVAVCYEVECACYRFVKPLWVAGGESTADGEHQTESGRRASGPLTSTDLQMEEDRKGNQ